MNRRRALIAAQDEKWDFQWDYTQGKLEDVSGVSVNKNGGSSSLTSNAERFTVPTGGKYYQIYFPSGGALDSVRTMTNGKGVLEVTFVGHISSVLTSSNIRMTAAESSTKRIVIFPSYNKFKVYDNSSVNNCTAIGDYANDTEYVVRIVYKGTTADVYVNGSLIKTNVSTGISVAGTSNCLLFQNIGDGYYVDLKSLRIRVGSL